MQRTQPLRPVISSYRYQSIDLLPESTDWFLYDRIIGLKRLRLVITYYHMDILAQQTTTPSQLIIRTPSAFFFSKKLIIKNKDIPACSVRINRCKNSSDHIETRQSICILNLLNGFYMIVILTLNWITCRSSHSQVFQKIGALKNFGIFTGKHLCWSLILIKLQAIRPKDLNTDVFL